MGGFATFFEYDRGLLLLKLNVLIPVLEAGVAHNWIYIKWFLYFMFIANSVIFRHVFRDGEDSVYIASLFSRENNN